MIPQIQLNEYQYACTNAAFFDLSDHGKIGVSGKDAAAFLHNLCTNDITRLAPGEGCEAFFTNAKARIIAYVWVQCGALDAGGAGYRIDTAAGLGQTLYQHLDHYLISEQVEITDRSEELAEIHIAGPQAGAIAAAAPGVQVERHQRVALDGYDLIFPAPDTAKVRQALEQAGAIAARNDVYNILRIETGVPSHGAEIDESRLAMEVGRTSQAISYTKGCYLGQETIVMARDRGHVNRALLGLKLTGDEPVAAGVKVFRGGEEIGQVTSSVFSPRVGSAIALAFLRRGHQQPGTVVDVESGDGGWQAEITELPFIPAS